MIKIILSRHAESEMNKLGILQGSLYDPPLSENGIKQAKSLAKRLEKENITDIYSGTKERAIQTSKIIGDALNLNIKEDERLNEFNMGDFDRTIDKDGELFKNFYKKELKKGISKYEIRPPNGENYWDLINRVESFIKDIIKGEGTILLVTHEGTLEVFLNILEGRDKEKEGFKRYHQTNASVNLAVFENKIWNILEVNDYKHLNLIKPRKNLYLDQEKIYLQIIDMLKEKIPSFINEAYLFGSVTEKHFGKYQYKFGRHHGSNIDILVVMEKKKIPIKWRFVNNQNPWAIYEIGKIKIEGVNHRIDFYVISENGKDLAFKRLNEDGWNPKKIK